MKITATAYDSEGNPIVCPECKKNGPGSIISGGGESFYTSCSECNPPKDKIEFVYRPPKDGDAPLKHNYKMPDVVVIKWDEEKEEWVKEIE